VGKQHAGGRRAARAAKLERGANGRGDVDYDSELEELALELVRLQKHNIAHDRRIVVVFEGRDGAGKDGMIRTITEHLSPRETRVVALGKPSEREHASWYFQRYVEQLPAADELVLFNRSWYNRAGVERVMGFAKKKEVETFLAAAPVIERVWVDAGIVLFKYYLDISRKEQARRLDARRKNPLKQWKISPIDAVALEKFDDYTKARDVMLARTHTPETPWTLVRADSNKLARLKVYRYLLPRLD
jgi:polyphosphate kinase